LESRYEGDFLLYSILIGAFLGFLLSIFRIKKYIDYLNKEEKQNKEKNKS
jgi:hypothetical protein